MAKDRANQASAIPVGRTMRAAHQAGRTLPPEEIIKSGELVEARFARGVSPSAAARKMLAILIQAAAGDAWKAGPHSVLKRDLRGTHNSNDRLDDTFDELQTTLLRLEVLAPDGQAAILVSPVVAYRIEHLENDDSSRVWWEFSEAARRAMQGSDHYAAMNRAVLLGFESRYSVTLYERGSLLAGRREPRWRGSVSELREVLGVPAGRYQNWNDLARFVVERACVEVNQAADFVCGWNLERGARNKVVMVELWFRRKDAAELAAAGREREAGRAGRKARRWQTATVASPLQPALQAALDDLREGRPLAGTEAGPSGLGRRARLGAVQAAALPAASVGGVQLDLEDAINNQAPAGAKPDAADVALAEFSRRRAALVPDDD